MRASGRIILHSRRRFPNIFPVTWEVRARRDVGPVLYFKFLSRAPTDLERIDGSTYRCCAMIEADEEGLEYNLGIGIRWEIPSDMRDAGVYVVNNTTEMVGGADPDANPIPGFGRPLDYRGIGRRLLRIGQFDKDREPMVLTPVEVWSS